MKDFAQSEDPAVQRQLDRLAALSLPQGRFGLETIRELLARLHALHQERQQRMQERGLAPTPPAPPVTPAD